MGVPNLMLSTIDSDAFGAPFAILIILNSFRIGCGA